jgi:hypothetical protein
MFSKIKLSLRNVNYKLYAALLLLGFVPTVYTTVRVFFLGQLPGDWSFSIAGQLSWVNLIYEILNEAIILPLFYFMGKVKDDQNQFTNRVCTGMLISLGIYAGLSVAVQVFAEPMLKWMAADTSILAASASYIRIESVANIFSVLSQFALVTLVSVNKSKYLSGNTFKLFTYIKQTTDNNNIIIDIINFMTFNTFNLLFFFLFLGISTPLLCYQL